MHLLLEVLVEAFPFYLFIAVVFIGNRYDERRRFKEYERQRREYTEWRMSHLGLFYRR